MASDSRGFPPGLPILATLIFLGAGGFFLGTSALKTLRPQPAPALWNESIEQGRSVARLWQDPLQAVMPEFEKWKAGQAATAPSSPSTLARWFAAEKWLSKRAATASAAQSTCSLAKGLTDRAITQRVPWAVMVVLVNGSSYADSEADRIDNRYAVLSALGESGFIPEDRETLGFFAWRRGDRPGSPEFAIPYEWYRREKPVGAGEGPQQTLVLWLRADATRSEHTLRDVGQLLDHLLPAGIAVRPDAILLTRNSNRLIDITHELAMELAGTEGLGWDLGRLNQSLRVFDWSATIAKDLLLDAVAARLGVSGFWEVAFSEPPASDPAQRRLQLEQGINEAARSHNISVDRLIGTDAELLALLAAELNLRGIVPGTGDAHVAIVHEWDTAYGRSIAPTFRAALPLKASAALHEYTFMKGVDGFLPVLVGRKEEPRPNASDPAKSSGSQRTEVPEGRSQLDYLRRLPERIEADRLATWQGGRLAAIGVFGDVYDKVPVLQALRGAFPDAVLFTTDLEARLVQASSDESLRNLLIASHYGLALAPDIQRLTPPLRSGYQTSLFAATLKALGNVRVLAEMDKASANQPKQTAGAGTEPNVHLDGLTGNARVYEVGRASIHDLSSKTPVTSEKLHPPTDQPYRLSRRWIVGGCAAIFAAIALFFFARRVARHDDDDRLADSIPVEPKARAVAATALLSIATAIIAAAASWNPGLLGEFSDTKTLAGRAIGLVPDLLLLISVVAFVRFACSLSRLRGAMAKSDADRASRAYLWILPPLLIAITAAICVIIRDERQASVAIRLAAIAVGIAAGGGIAWAMMPRDIMPSHWVARDSWQRVGASAILPLVFLVAVATRLWSGDVSGSGIAAGALAAMSGMLPGFLAAAAVTGAAVVYAPPIAGGGAQSEWSTLFRMRNWCVLATALVVFLVVSRGIEIVQAAKGQEPVAVWEGISAWPSIAIRGLIILTGLWFLVVIREDSRANIRTVTNRWSLLGGAALRRALDGHLRIWPPPTIVGWTERTVTDYAQSRNLQLTYGEALWEEYATRGRSVARSIRTGMLFGLFALLILPISPSIWRIATTSGAPRGDWARELHAMTFLVSGLVVVYVTLAVWDVSNLCQRFIVLLSKDLRHPSVPPRLRESCWHADSLAEVLRRTGIRGGAADIYLSIRVIADRTAWVSVTIYYPFVLIVLMLVAGASGFDAWPHSWQFMLAIAMPAIIALLAARSLQTTAKRARDRLLERLAREIGRSVAATSIVAAEDGPPLAPSSASVELRKLGAAGSSVTASELVSLGRSGDRQDVRMVAVTMELKSTEPGGAESFAVAVEPPPWSVTEGIAGDRQRCVVATAEGTRLVLDVTRTATAGPWHVTATRCIGATQVTADDVKLATTLANGIRSGAFASYGDNAVLRAVLLPFGGFGAIQVFEYVTRLM